MNDQCHSLALLDTLVIRVLNIRPAVKITVGEWSASFTGTVGLSIVTRVMIEYTRPAVKITVGE